MTSRNCPALLIAAPASGQGKTTVTAALARLHARQGKRVRVFKCGPDFLDPMVLARASGRPVYQLDLWMVGEEESRRLLWEAAGEADLILIEGVMGLFDGAPSAADLARRFGVPVLTVIDGSAMAQTFGALAHGLKSFQLDLPFAGVLANRVGSTARRDSARQPAGVDSLVRRLPRSVDVELPSRHPGWCRPRSWPISMRAWMPRPMHSRRARKPNCPGRQLCGADSRFAGTAAGRRAHRCGARCRLRLLYQANLDLLQALGAELLFSRRCALPACPRWTACTCRRLPRAAPACTVAQRTDGRGDPRASCSRQTHPGRMRGMLYLLDGLTDRGDERVEMLGLLPGEARMQQRLSALALQEVELPEGRLRGHTFHHSTLESPPQPLAHGECPNYKRTAEAVYRSGRLTASYIHFYLPSDPLAARRCSGHERTRLQRRGARRGLPRHCRAP